MEEYKFKLEIFGTVTGYSEEHVRNVVSEVWSDVACNIVYKTPFKGKSTEAIIQINKEIPEIVIPGYEDLIYELILGAVATELSELSREMENIIVSSEKPSYLKGRDYVSCIQKLRAVLSNYDFYSIRYPRNTRQSDRCKQHARKDVEELQRYLSKVHLSIISKEDDPNE